VRYAAELSFPDTIQALSAAHPNQFTFLPVVSREDCELALRGRIPDLVADGRLEGRAHLQIAAADSQIMICGNPDMVKTTSTALQQRGLERNRRRSPGHITVENYW
jgi:ferredoxin--NADP+ reductase